MPRKRKKNLARALGATELLSSERLTIYIPDRDKTGKKIRRFRYWIREAAKILAIMGRGTTAMPPADVLWIRSENVQTPEQLKQSDIVEEKTVVMYSYVDPSRLEKSLPRLRKFLHRFGRETNQRELVIEYNGHFYSIKPQ